MTSGTTSWVGKENTMPAGAHGAFLIVAIILFLLCLAPPLKSWMVSIQSIGLAFFAASFLVG